MYRFEQRIGNQTVIYEGKEIWDALKKAFPDKNPFENIYLSYLAPDLPVGLPVADGNFPEYAVFEFKRVRNQRYCDHYVYHGLLYCD